MMNGQIVIFEGSKEAWGMDLTVGKEYTVRTDSEMENLLIVVDDTNENVAIFGKNVGGLKGRINCFDIVG